MVDMRLIQKLVTVYKADQRDDISTVGKLESGHYNYEERTNK